MLPETGGANHFTLIVADRLEGLGRPVSVDELVGDVARVPDLPWSWITQRHQAYVAVHRDAVQRSRETLASTNVSVSDAYDPALGWHVDGYDVKDPTTKLRALRYCVGKVIQNSKKGRPWVIFEGDGQIRRNPDVHPRVFANGKAHSWDPATRAESKAGTATFVQTANARAIDRLYAGITRDERATIMRHLAAMLPKERKAWMSGAVRRVVKNIDQAYGSADAATIFALIGKLAALDAAEGALEAETATQEAERPQ